jgi:hypothetical protein
LNLRIRFVVAALALLAWAHGATAREVSVVKVINFSCAACRASESQDGAIRTAVQATGGRFVFATVPLSAQTYWRELLYYAARERDAALEPQVRQSLYRGAQDMGLPFADVSQVAVWLVQDLPDAQVDWAALARQALESNAPRQALGRAMRLVVSAGVQRVPAYVFVVDGEVAGLLDADTGSRTGSLVELRRSVIERIEQLARPAR